MTAAAAATTATAAAPATPAPATAVSAGRHRRRNCTQRLDGLYNGRCVARRTQLSRQEERIGSHALHLAGLDELDDIVRARVRLDDVMANTADGARPDQTENEYQDNDARSGKRVLGLVC